MPIYKVTTTLWCKLRHTEGIEASDRDSAQEEHESRLRDCIGDCDIEDVDSHAVKVLVDMDDPELV